jgi:hypothetical protein
LLALSWEEKAALAPSFEGQLVPLANHIVQLRRRPEFTAINQTADRLLRPAKSNSLPEEEVAALCRYYLLSIRLPKRVHGTLVRTKPLFKRRWWIVSAFIVLARLIRW